MAIDPGEVASKVSWHIVTWKVDRVLAASELLLLLLLELLLQLLLL